MKRAHSASPEANSSKEFTIESSKTNELDNKLLKESNKTNSTEKITENIEQNDNEEPCSKLSKDIPTESAEKLDVKENNKEIHQKVLANSLFDDDIDIDLQTESIKHECPSQEQQSDKIDEESNKDDSNVKASSNEQAYRFFDESSQSDEEEGKSYHVDYVYHEAKKPEYDALEARRESKRRSRRRKKFPGIKEDFENPLVQKWIARKCQEVEPGAGNAPGGNINASNAIEKPKMLLPPTTLPGNLPPSNAASQKLNLQKHQSQSSQSNNTHNKQMINILLAAAAGLSSPNNKSSSGLTSMTDGITATTVAHEYMNNTNPKYHHVPLHQNPANKMHFYSQRSPSSIQQPTMRLSGPLNLVPIICNPSHSTNIRHISSSSDPILTKKEQLLSCSPNIDNIPKHILRSKGLKPTLISCSTATTDCIDLQSSRYDRIGHFPAIRDDPGNCQWCIETNPSGNNHKKYSSPSFSSAVACIKCGVYLCLERHRNCFLDFHTSINKHPHVN